mmetsp:Transcript_23729/g.65857  ORF Transcript_23729/g.65857 Transcript_23729/m.65857 type:complete len:419 (-) Transcript_23729:34-1290(-)
MIATSAHWVAALLASAMLAAVRVEAARLPRQARWQIGAIGAPFSEDSTHRSNVHDPEPPQGARNFSITLSQRIPNVSERGGQLTFLWGDGDAEPNPLWDAEMNFALFQGSPGNVRELHWHPDAAEWAQVLSGTCFATMMDPEGKIANNELETGDVWYFPRNWPHAVQAGADGCRAALFFNSPEWIPTNDFGISQMVTRFPANQMAGSLGVKLERAAEMKAQLSGVIGGSGPILLSMAEVPEEAWPVPPERLSRFNPTWRFLSQEPKMHYGASTVQQLFQSTFTFSTDMSGEYDVIAPGAVRTIHWHTNAGELSYLVTGLLNMTVVSFGGASIQSSLDTGDIGWAPVGFAHSYECVSVCPCELLLVWNTGNLQTIELAPWVRFSPPSVVASNLNITQEQLHYFTPGNIFSQGSAETGIA